MKFKDSYKCKFRKHFVETAVLQSLNVNINQKNCHQKIFKLHTFSYANAEKSENKNTCFNILLFFKFNVLNYDYFQSAFFHCTYRLKIVICTQGKNFRYVISKNFNFIFLFKKCFLSFPFFKNYFSITFNKISKKSQNLFLS